MHVCVYRCSTCSIQYRSVYEAFRKIADSAWKHENHTAILIVFEGHFQVFQRFSSSSQLVLQTVESCFVALNYDENGSTNCKANREPWSDCLTHSVHKCVMEHFEKLHFEKLQTWLGNTNNTHCKANREFLAWVCHDIFGLGRSRHF